MRQKYVLLISIYFFLSTSQSFSQRSIEQQSSLPLRRPVDRPMATLVNINNISMWVQADGKLGRNSHTNDSGVIYPRETSYVVYCDGIIWAGFVKDGHNPELRVGGQRWRSGTVPGYILSKGMAEDPDHPDVRLWRIRRDWQRADLNLDAAESFNIPLTDVTQAHIESIRAQYERDWNEWPWERGAPFYDANGNGILDEGEEPGLAHADQIIWFVVNDLDSVVTKDFFDTPPIGLEMQVTLWAYDRKGSRLNEVFQHVIFKRVRLIYKGRVDTPATAHIDSMFIGQFVDSDIGAFSDDFAGCDTSLQLGYGYNSSSLDVNFRKLDLVPPAFGYTWIQGPMVASPDPSDMARCDFGNRTGFVNLPMTSFWHKATGSSIGDPENTTEMYYLMNGFLPWDWEMLPFIDLDGKPTKFMVSGDPVKGTGWYDGYSGDRLPHGQPLVPGERRFQMNSGPFTMALGDTQEVIIAMVGGLGSDYLASVSVMKHHVRWVRCWAQTVFQEGLDSLFPEESPKEDEITPQNFRLYQNYPNPFNVGTEIRYDLPVQKPVKLTIYNLLGQMVRVLVDENQEAQSYKIRWDGTDSSDEKVPTGLYLYRIEAGSFILMKKMLLVE